MATSTALVSIDEYLTSLYKPGREYIDGILREKPMPTWDHGAIQSRLAQLINDQFGEFAAATEITVRVSESRFFVPDVVVQRKTELQRPYPVKPVHLVIEVLSPEDRMSDAIAKCEEYHAWGVRFCWLIDPEERFAWNYEAGHRPLQIHSGDHLRAGLVEISLSDLFAVLPPRL